jgi:hypothetical protein
MRKAASGLGVLLGCALLAAQAHAEVLTYYYATGPAIVGGPGVEYAIFNFDTDKLPAGETLAGRTFHYYDGPDEITSDPGWWLSTRDFESHYFSAVQDDIWVDLTYSFDENGELADFSYSNSSPGADDWYNSSLSKGDYNRSTPAADGSYLAETVLKGLGYHEGSAAYDDLVCGSWSPVYTGDCDPQLWLERFRSAPGAGTLTRDPAVFAEALLRSERLSRAQPPVSYADIPPAPVPVPASVALLLGGLGAFGLVGRRRTAWASDRAVAVSVT